MIQREKNMVSARKCVMPQLLILHWNLKTRKTQMNTNKALPSTECPSPQEQKQAVALWRDFLQAVSGNALKRRTLLF